MWVVYIWSRRFSCRWEKTGGTFPPHIYDPFYVLLMKLFSLLLTWSDSIKSKIFRHVQIYSAVHVHEFSTHFCIIWFSIPFPFMFTPHDDPTGKMLKGSLFKIHMTWTFIQNLKQPYVILFNFFNYYLLSYPDQNHHLKNTLTPLSKSY